LRRDSFAHHFDDDHKKKIQGIEFCGGHGTRLPCMSVRVTTMMDGTRPPCIVLSRGGMDSVFSIHWVVCIDALALQRSALHGSVLLGVLVSPSFDYQSTNGVRNMGGWVCFTSTVVIKYNGAAVLRSQSNPLTSVFKWLPVLMCQSSQVSIVYFFFAFLAYGLPVS
jgi:hypothetical protein